MKKYILSAMALVCAAFASTAQTGSDEAVQQQYDQHYVDSINDALNRVNNLLDDMEMKERNKKVWGRGRYLRLGYAISENALEGSPKEKSKFAFYLSKGTTYLFPSKPIAGVLKVGFDVVWFDMQFSKYKSPYGDGSDGWTTPWETGGNDGDGDGEFDLNIGRMSVNIGAFGIGPNVSVAPFARCGVGGLRPLRASVYFHFQPSVGAYIMSEDGTTEASFAYCNMFDLGGNISYRGVALGVEARWGSGKFKPIEFGDGEGDGIDVGFGEKFTRKYANTRFYIQFSF